MKKETKHFILVTFKWLVTWGFWVLFFMWTWEHNSQGQYFTALMVTTASFGFSIITNQEVAEIMGFYNKKSTGEKRK